MEIIEIKEYSDDVLDVLNELLPQLSSAASLLTESEVKEIIESECSFLFMAKDADVYIGSLTLVVFSTPTGKRAWIEDVVVSEKARGKGIGRLLTEHAMKLGNSLELESINLTSRASRVAANALYKKVGFTERETNVYQYKNNS